MKANLSWFFFWLNIVCALINLPYAIQGYGWNLFAGLFNLAVAAFIWYTENDRKY